MGGYVHVADGISVIGTPIEIVKIAAIKIAIDLPFIFSIFLIS